ncbi:hypothetical protein [Mycolicibacterium palauense]|uniref:hypothetical protein n=1 Tax=Mycolicibacterium palauense TaxID=2034511 RepID=UPI00159BACD0|nr:hypothetical protein [Mycolicibacterium palauense]
MSVDHPFAIHAIQRRDGQRTDYFATYSWTEEWTMGGSNDQNLWMTLGVGA